ncbi:MAG TPA: alkaline phosphatase family protein [Bryobacteraceae bacterium]|nr:alkaline phosphatase family protein [Bryobacteraceae bacterium]
MPAGLDNLKHIVVLMMENRSFDHMLGSLRALDPRINGLTGNETNPDTTNEPAKVLPQADFQGQLDPDPDHHFPAVNKQLFFGTGGPPAAPSMQGFVQSYFDQQHDVKHSRKIMYYFTPDKLPVLSALARSFAVFNGWFASIPGPTICNRAFAHYGTSFGSVGMDPFVVKPPYVSIYDRMLNAGRTSKLYYFDPASSTMEVVNLLSNQPKIFATYDQFLKDCELGELPDYSFIEPNYKDHEGPGGGELLASDQHPDHDVQSGEIFIATIYNAIHQNPDLWKSTALLIVYDEHGGIFDHVPPPACVADAPFVASAADTGTGVPFAFDRLGVRVPAVLVSPWVQKSTVVPGPEDAANGRTFEHASIPGTVTQHFIGAYNDRSPREKAAPTFLDLLGDNLRPNSDCPAFNFE